jgi:hypothetical protein
VDRKEYLRIYRSSPEYKAKNAERMRKRRTTAEGKDYDKSNAKTLKSRFTKAKRWNTKHRKTMDGIPDLKEWTLTYDQYAELVTQNCSYCNRSLRDETGSGLDRIDNSRGYLPGNVNPCCSECNRIRGDSMGADEFRRQTKLNGRWVEYPGEGKK